MILFFVVMLVFLSVKAPLPPSAYSPNKLGEIVITSLPQLVGEVPEGGWGSLRRIFQSVSSYLQEDVMDNVRSLKFARQLRAHQT
jgi:hypothetical protein